MTTADTTPTSSHSALCSLCNLSVGSIMTSPVQTAHENWSIKMLLDYFVQHKITGMPVVCNDGLIHGVVTMSDVMRFENLPATEKNNFIRACYYSEYAGYEFGDDELARMMQSADTNCAVSQIMTRRVISIDSSASVPDAARLMREHNIHRIFVVDGQKFLGVISTSNILDALIGAC